MLRGQLESENSDNVPTPSLSSLGIPNENRAISWTVDFPDWHRVIVTLYNETIYLNNGKLSSKMFLKYNKQYRSCSMWMCQWKNEVKSRFLAQHANLQIKPGAWSALIEDQVSAVSSPIVTQQISEWKGTPYAMLNFSVNGPVMLTYKNKTNFKQLYWY
jgi:hypothetical protein